MSVETISSPAEPLFDPSHIGASLERANRLVMPITSSILRGMQYGDIESPQSGQGMEIDGVRDYQVGDDTRYIDWVLTARSPDGIPKLRQHHQDVTPSVWLATDLAQERNRITPGSSFSEQELALSAATAMLLLGRKESMPTGLLATSDYERVQSAKPSLGRSHILHMSKQLVSLTESRQHQPDSERQHLGTTLKRLGNIASDSLIVVVSDFRDVASPDDSEGGWKKPLQQLKHKGNEIIAIETTNPWDYEMNERTSRIKLQDSVAWVGGKQGKKIRQTYTEDAHKQQETIDQALASVGAAHVKLSTDDEKWFTSLRTQLHKAARRNR